MSKPIAAVQGGIRHAFGAVGHFAKKHKVWTVLIALALVAGIAVPIVLLRTKNAASDAVTYSYIRTTTLAKGTLDDTVSTTGTVESADTSTVSYNAAAGTSTPKIKTVNVAVGDSVTAGDVIVTLDTSDIEESITKEKENIAKAVSKAQDAYNTAKTAYDTAVSTAESYESTVTSASSTLAGATAAYNTAAASVATFQSTYDAANTGMVNAGTDLNNKTAALNTANAALAAAQTALANAQSALAAGDAASSGYAALQAAVSAAQSAYDAAKAAADAAQTAVNNAQAAYASAQTVFQNAETALNTAKNQSNYNALAQAYAAAQQAYTQARTTLDNEEKQVSTTKDALTAAKEALDDASTSDTLETLEEQLDACSLTAETGGKVTSLTASVGATPSGTIATIQDTASLKVAITIEEADINSVSIGMTCRITSDATDATINGTLTQIDPVAGQDGSFGAEVTVTDADSGLLVGMNATVEIVLSSTSDCFTVPIDAVGTDDSTGDYVLRQTGGSGTDMTFEKVYVTTGDSNDYYIEISSDSLAEGDVIRSSADLSVGVEETSASSDASNMMFNFGGQGAQQSGNMPSGGDMPSGGGQPSGGGGQPSGGGQ